MIHPDVRTKSNRLQTIPPTIPLRDWSLITGRGGVYKMGKFCALPQDRVKLFAPPPPFKEWKPFVTPPPL